MKDTLLRTLSSESLTLLLDIQRYRSIDLPIARGAIAQEMYFMFIAPRYDYITLSCDGLCLMMNVLNF
jgi:hypothetical protein